MYCPFRKETKKWTTSEEENFQYCYGEKCMAHSENGCKLMERLSAAPASSTLRVITEDAHYGRDF